jgi:hypothetical protein
MNKDERCTYCYLTQLAFVEIVFKVQFFHTYIFNVNSQKNCDVLNWSSHIFVACNVRLWRPNIMIHIKDCEKTIKDKTSKTIGEY